METKTTRNNYGMTIALFVEINKNAGFPTDEAVGNRCWFVKVLLITEVHT
jgi:hypothetical protein